MASTISPSDSNSVQNNIGRTLDRVPRVPHEGQLWLDGSIYKCEVWKCTTAFDTEEK